MKALSLAGVTLGIFLSGCEKKPSPTTENPAQTTEVDRVTALGREASQALMQSLTTQLTAALQAGNSASAMQACQQVAPLTTVAIGQNHPEVESVRRTTLKPRNPGNAPDEIDEKVLLMLQSTVIPPDELIEWTNGTARYYKPLVIKEICVNCHGPKSGFSPELVDKLATLYPGDQATDYQLGDLRGVIRVDIKRSPTEL